MALISLRAYARHRQEKGYVGGALRAVQQAIASGRLKESLSLDEFGVTKINSLALADQEWNANTRMDYVRAPEQAARVEAQMLAAPPPAPVPPSPPPAPPPVPALPPPVPMTPPPRPPLEAVAAVIGEETQRFILDDELVNWEIADDAPLATATKAKAIWAARQAALDYAEQRRLLIPVAEVESAIASVIQISKTKLLGIPTAAKGRIPSMTHGELVVIESLIREALSELCDFRPQAN